MLKDRDGQIINIGGGMREERNVFGGAGEAGTMILITGTAEWQNTDEGTFVIYRGQRIKSTPEKPLATTGSASTVDPVDWDGDGDVDLIVGNSTGSVYLITNQGMAKDYAFAKETPLRAGGHALKVAGRAGPCAADWDGDGDLDLLVGAEDGSVSLFRNTGTARAPELASAVQLAEPGVMRSGSAAPENVCRGGRSKICVADWNGDGRPDLLVGDVAYQKPDRPDPTAEEKAEHERIRAEIDTLRQRSNDLRDRLYGPARVSDKDEHKRLQEEHDGIIKQIGPLYAMLPREYETHGWVWLFLRK